MLRQEIATRCFIWRMYTSVPVPCIRGYTHLHYSASQHHLDDAAGCWEGISLQPGTEFSRWRGNIKQERQCARGSQLLSSDTLASSLNLTINPSYPS